MSGPIVTGRTVAPGRQRRILPPARYRHPGDVIRLVAAGLVLAGAVAAGSALVAGLAGVGMASGLAVSAVLLYRLATDWLPVAPGWVSFRLLRRWEYV